jgi:hypothetical protein
LSMMSPLVTMGSAHSVRRWLIRRLREQFAIAGTQRPYDRSTLDLKTAVPIAQD